MPSKKNQSVLIAKISSRITQKIANLQKQTPAKISCHIVSKTEIYIFRVFIAIIPTHLLYQK